jgi:hypothetical protein
MLFKVKKCKTLCFLPILQPLNGKNHARPEITVPWQEKTPIEHVGKND